MAARESAERNPKSVQASKVLGHFAKTDVCSGSRSIFRFVRALQYRTNFVQKDLAGFGFATAAPSEIFRRISQSLSPAGVTSPFVARAMPTACASVMPVSGR